MTTKDRLREWRRTYQRTIDEAARTPLGALIVRRARDGLALLDLVEAQHEALMAWERETRFTPAHKKAMRAYNDFGGAK